MRRLKLSEWAHIAEIIGAVAVVFSLIYVGIQVQENTSEVRATNRQALIDRASQAVGSVAANPDLALAIFKASEGAAFTPAELTQYRYFMRGLLYDVQEAYLLHQEGRLDDEYWRTRAALVVAYFSVPPARDIYEQDVALGVLHVDYAGWLNAALEERLAD